jgi:DNA-binding Lrp family transcriptional regulator
VPPGDEQVGGRDDAAIRRRHQRRVVAWPERNAGTGLAEPADDPRDQPELTGVGNRSDPRTSDPIACLLVECDEEVTVPVQAYILIQTEVGKAAAVAAEIAGITGVTLAEDVTGPYDVIVRAEARNVDELGKLVVAQVQGAPGITRTLTCPIVHF